MDIRIFQWDNNFKGKWDSLINDLPRSNLFNSSIWIQTILDSYNCNIIIPAIIRESQLLIGIPLIKIYTPCIGNRFISLPFTDYITPASDSIIAQQVLLNELSNWDKCIQLRFESMSTDIGNTQHIGYIHRLALDSDINFIYKKFDKDQIQRRLKKIEYLDNLKIEISYSDEDLKIFQAILLKNRLRLKSFIPHERYFKNLQNNFFVKGKGFVALTKYNSEYIAGGVFLKYKNTLHFKHGASLKEYWYLHPNHFLIWSIIKIACNEGFEYLDFGRTSIGDQSLRNFKLSWGVDELDLNYVNINPPKPVKVKSALRIRRMVGSSLYYFPFVSKSLSQTMYRLYP